MERRYIVASTRFHTAESPDFAPPTDNDDQSDCIVHERYRESEALIEHASHLGDLNELIIAAGDLRRRRVGGP